MERNVVLKINAMVKKRMIHLFFALFLIMTISVICSAQVRVKGYYRKDGTYVRPHVRSNPDNSNYYMDYHPG